MAYKHTVIVTGASRGIGAAIVKVLLHHGYSLVERGELGTGLSSQPALDIAESSLAGVGEPFSK